MDNSHPLYQLVLQKINQLSFQFLDSRWAKPKKKEADLGKTRQI